MRQHSQHSSYKRKSQRDNRTWASTWNIDCDQYRHYQKHLYKGEHITRQHPWHPARSCMKLGHCYWGSVVPQSLRPKRCANFNSDWNQCCCQFLNLENIESIRIIYVLYNVQGYNILNNEYIYIFILISAAQWSIALAGTFHKQLGAMLPHGMPAWLSWFACVKP